VKKATAVAALALAACGSPESFEEQSADIQTAEAQGVNLVVKARQQMVAESLAMTQLGMLIEEIALGVQAELPGPVEQTEFVQLQLGYASTDRLGNEATVDFGTVRLPIGDLREAQIDNLTGTQFLELADKVSPGPAIDPAIQYCSDMDNFRFNPVWCQAVGEGLGLGDYN